MQRAMRIIRASDNFGSGLGLVNRIRWGSLRALEMLSVPSIDSRKMWSCGRPWEERQQSCRTPHAR